jgi:membrane protein implicated in regulation of membrane protease activity
MDEHLVWAILGLALVIAELLTGTFYLFVLGAASFGGALIAWLGGEFPIQATGACVVAGIGFYFVHLYRARNAQEQMAAIDSGQPATFESWLDQGAGLARVRYRGAVWDARLDGGAALEPGAVVYVLATEGNVLKVSARRPA